MDTILPRGSWLRLLMEGPTPKQKRRSGNRCLGREFSKPGGLPINRFGASGYRKRVTLTKQNSPERGKGTGQAPSDMLFRTGFLRLSKTGRTHVHQRLVRIHTHISLGTSIAFSSWLDHFPGVVSSTCFLFFSGYRR